MANVSPRALARNKLLEFYRREVEETGQKPSEEQFFPVDLVKFMRVTLPEWRMLDLPDLRHGVHPISGKADSDQKIIYLDSAASTNRKKFTAAHELGHVLLNHGGCRLRMDFGPRSILRPEQLEPPDTNELRQERDANVFAVELLMPERTVAKEFKKRFAVDRLGTKSSQAQSVLQTTYSTAADTAKDLATSHYSNATRSLVEFFGVSTSAMQRRLLELKLVY